ncbi:MAG: helix-turn-helix domain containing protein [Azospirillaceae bacterium]|nr:helix-turn-helix domain containing protein [Azospirillaceae bacterium]
MPDSPEQGPSRKPRADGERNRSLLIAAAKQAFAEKGTAASLEQIARDAGVGIGTLYRHFPTRDALVEAVYRQESDALVEAAARLAADLPPVEALRAWLLLFIEYLAAKEGMTDALNALIGGTDALYSASSARITDAIGTLARRAAETGAIRLDIEPLDLVRAIAGLAKLNPAADWKRSAIRMVDILLNGLRVGP